MGLSADVDGKVWFSNDGRYAYATNNKGDVFVFDLAKRKSSEHTPIFHLNVPPIKFGNSAPQPPTIAFSPNGDWICILDGKADVYIVPTVSNSTDLQKPIYKSRGFFGPKLPQFSPDDQWAAWTANPGTNEVTVYKLDTGQKLIISSPTTEAESLPDSSFNLSFSSSSTWLVGRQTFEPFITWNLSAGVSSTGVLSAGVTRTSEDRRGDIWFSPDGSWVAGIANDKKLHMWRTSDPPGLKSSPLFVEEYTQPPFPAFAFDSEASRAAAVGPDGGLYVWTLGKDLDLGRPLAYHYARAQVEFSRDGKYVYSVDLRNIYLGSFDDVLSLVATSKSQIQVVTTTPDFSQLVIFAAEQLITVKRSFYLWGIRLWRLEWPMLTKPIYLTSEEE
jgi:hypothetical protein